MSVMLPRPGGSEGTLWSSNQAGTCHIMNSAKSLFQQHCINACWLVLRNAENQQGI